MYPMRTPSGERCVVVVARRDFLKATTPPGRTKK
jgi:hypothetical protein